MVYPDRHGVAAGHPDGDADPDAHSVRSFQGETATPFSSPTSTPSETPFESFQGETAAPESSTTPPPTSTDGSNSGDGGSQPFALLIALVFGALGLVAVAGQRHALRR